MLTACENTYKTNENLALSKVNQEAAEKFVMDSIPEIEKYSAFIEQKSGGNANLTIDINFVKTEKDNTNYYVIYVGVQREDYRVNWDYFYVDENLQEVMWYDIVDAKLYSLDEWRNSQEYKQRIAYIEEYSLKSEKIMAQTNYMNRRDCNLLIFDDVIFLRNTEYRYKDGEYKLTGKKLTDYIPVEDRESMNDLFRDHSAHVLQNKNCIIYSLYDKEVDEYRTVVIDFPTGKVRGSFILQEEICAVYDNRAYYKAMDEETGYYSLEYLDCNDFTSHTLYSTENYLNSMMVRADGMIIFGEEGSGFFIIDTEGNVKKIHDAIPNRKLYAKEMFNRFDDSGLYLFIEYYTGEENARLTENGELFRIRDNCTQNNLELPQGILVREGNRAALYECQKETCPVKDLRIRGEVVWTSPLQEYEIIEQKYLDAGYEMVFDYYQNDTVWWLWRDAKEQLIVTKTEI